MKKYISCGCPIAFSAKRTLPNGKVLYASQYGLKCWPITIHSKNCLHYKKRRQFIT
jgi:hypothetical protein